MTTSMKPADYLDFYCPEPLVKENAFAKAVPDRSFPPAFAEIKDLLPLPTWEGHEAAIACYWKAWEIAFKNLRRVHVGNKFIKPYIDTAFNDCLFLWDSCFILMFGKYGQRAFTFQQTLDNLYAKQHPDGFISREITEWSGQDRFHRYDPASTGPNILAWCEWEYYLNFNDKERLARVFPVLMAYHRWCRKNRTWPDGSYHSCGLACGMDNQPRVLPDYSPWSDHSHMAWIDATAQALLSARLLVKMAAELGRSEDPAVLACTAEIAVLKRYIHTHMWDELQTSFCDRHLSEGPSEHSRTATIGAYWVLLADAIDPERVEPFVSRLDDPKLFNRPVRVPSLAATHDAYEARGGYWLGGVWPSTNYMVLRGLTHIGQDDLAADIAKNYHYAVTRLFETTGTIWENMAPEFAEGSTEPRPGDPAKGDFVGWGGLGPIAVLFEYVFGIRADIPRSLIVWDVRLLESFSVERYPFGRDGTLSFRCAARASPSEEPVIEVVSNVPVTLELRWGRTASHIGGERSSREHRASATHHSKVIRVSPA